MPPLRELDMLIGIDFFDMYTLDRVSGLDYLSHGDVGFRKMAAHRNNRLRTSRDTVFSSSEHIQNQGCNHTHGAFNNHVCLVQFFG